MVDAETLSLFSGTLHEILTKGRNASFIARPFMSRSLRQKWPLTPAFQRRGAKRQKRNEMTETAPWTTRKPTAILVLADGTVIEGTGIGATGKVQAEVCFNTALTGYEILTDPSLSRPDRHFHLPAYRQCRHQ